MIDRLREQIQERLDQLLADADKLRHALAALNPRTSSTDTKTPAPARAAAPQEGGRTAGSAHSSAAKQRTGTPPAGLRTPPGETRRAVLAALGDGTAMTSGEVAAATGIA